jgi:hypothetical protein
VSPEYSSQEEARRDNLCRPLSMSEVMRRTGRTQRTIERWIAEGRLTRYELEHPRQIVFVEREVLELERDKRRAARQGRPRPPMGTQGDGVDAEG